MPQSSRFVLPLALLASLGSALAGPLSAQEAAPPEAPPATATAPKEPEHVDAGAYLAARFASTQNDFLATAYWLERVLATDNSRPDMLENAMFMDLTNGELEAAIAKAAILHEGGMRSQAITLSRMAEFAQKGDYAAILADQKAGLGLGKLMDGLLRGWAELGLGHPDEALAAFGQLAQVEGLEPFALYHKALALAAVGNFEAAERLFAGEEGGPITVVRRAALAYVQILSQLERNEEAIAFARQAWPLENDPWLAAQIARLEAGEMLDYDIARNATEGIAEVVFTLAAALSADARDSYTLAYATTAQYLRPDHNDALLLAATTRENLEQYEQAAATYARIAIDSDAGTAAQIGQARTLDGAGKADEAVEVLRGLIAANPQVISFHLTLGDLLRQAERWSEAAQAYSAAVALLPSEDEAGFWSLFYTRAITYERLNDWPKAEADFRRALALNPGQPQVLNYLGYSMLDRKLNLDEAMALIQEAVTASPDAGYIVDSWAWGLFMLGRYDEAVEPMERASLLEPLDPTVTDHLGDVYWAVGRQLEARFQWRRALSFNPEEDAAERIREKLAIGLDAVRAKEGEPALSDVTPPTAAQP